MEKKRFLALLLVLAMMLAWIPMTALADEQPKAPASEGELVYRLVTDGSEEEAYASLDTLNATAGCVYSIRFYYHDTAQNKYTALVLPDWNYIIGSPSSDTMPLEIRSMETTTDGDFYYRLSFIGAGEVTLTFQNGETSYSHTFQVTGGASLELRNDGILQWSKTDNKWMPTAKGTDGTETGILAFPVGQACAIRFYDAAAVPLWESGYEVTTNDPEIAAVEWINENNHDGKHWDGTPYYLVTAKTVGTALLSVTKDGTGMGQDLYVVPEVGFYERWELNPQYLQSEVTYDKFNGMSLLCMKWCGLTGDEAASEFTVTLNGEPLEGAYTSGGRSNGMVGFCVVVNLPKGLDITQDSKLTVSGDALTATCTLKPWTLPEGGFFTAPEYAEENYCTSLLYDDQETTLWYMVKEGLSKEAAEKAVVKLYDCSVEGTGIEVSAEQIKDENYAVKIVFPANLGDKIKEEGILSLSLNGSSYVGLTVYRPYLRYHDMYWIDADQIQETEGNWFPRLDRCALSPGDRAMLRLYYGTGSDAAALPDGTLTSSDETVLTVEKTNEGAVDGKPYFKLSALKLGTTTLTYTAAGGQTVYQMTIEISLPDAGFYTQPKRSVETWISGSGMGYVTGEEKTIYALWNYGDFQSAEEALKGVRVRFGNDYITDKIKIEAVSYIDEEWSTEQECYGLKLTIPGDLDFGGYIGKLFQVEKDDMPYARTSLYREGLQAHFMERNENDQWYERDNAYIPDFEEYRLSPGQTGYLRFGYGWGDYQPLPYGELTSSAPNVLSVEKRTENSADGDPYYLLLARAYGETTLTYTYKDADGKTQSRSAAMKVTIPPVGFFSEPVRTQEHYLDAVKYDPEKGTTVYLMAENGLSDKLKFMQTLLGGQNIDLNPQYVPLNDGTGTGCWSMTLPAGLAFGQYTDLYIRAEDANGWGYGHSARVIGYTTSASFSFVHDAVEVREALLQPRFSTREWRVFFKDTQLTKTDYTVSSTGDAEASVTEEGLLRVTRTGWGNATVTVTYGSEKTTLSCQSDENQEQEHTFNGKKYKIMIGVSDIQGDGTMMTGNVCSNMPKGSEYPTERTFVVSVFGRNSDGQWQEEPLMIHALIQSVEFQIVDDPYGVMSFTDDGTRSDSVGRFARTVRHEAPEGGAIVQANITLWDGTTVTLKNEYVHRLNQTTRIDCAARGIDTMEELQALIDSEELKNEAAKAQDLNILLDGSATYKGVLKLPELGGGVNEAVISLEGRGATIQGSIVVTGNFRGFLSGIKFVKSDASAKNSKDETVGLLCDGGELLTINNCSLTGYDVALESNETGFISANGGNTFEDNKIAIRIDCAAREWGNGNRTTHHSTFKNNGTAIQLLGLPQYIPAFDFRIFAVDFLGNDVDIDAQGVNLPLYFYRNYFGDANGRYRVPQLQNADNVRTELRYRYLLSERPEGTQLLIIDPRVKRVSLPNKDAGTMLLSASELDRELTLDVVDESDRTLGSWQFEPSAAALSAIALYDAEESTQSADFNAGLEIKGTETGKTVTVTDSTALSECQPTLSIVCNADWSGAVVMHNGEPIGSVWASESGVGTIRFEVKEGGTYEIMKLEDALSAAWSGDASSIEVKAPGADGALAFAAFYADGVQLAIDSAVIANGSAVVAVPDVAFDEARVFLLDAQVYRPLAEKITLQKQQ